MASPKDVKNTCEDVQNEMQGRIKQRRGAKKSGSPDSQVDGHCLQRKEDVARPGPFSIRCCRRRAPEHKPQRGEYFVQDMRGCRLTQDSERCHVCKGELVALATPPVELAVQLPADHEPRQPVTTNGPHGSIEVFVPPDAKPGSTLRLRLAPHPDFRVEVPRGARAGCEITLKRADGVEISVQIPAGLKPGDTFNICPPALMVQVPKDAKPGDCVVFREPGADEADWCRARVPEGAAPGSYFAARLPPPGETTSNAGARAPKLSNRAKGA